MAKEADPAGILALVELVAAAAVTCDDKEIFVTRIMNLEEESARELQAILQDVLGRLTNFDEGGEKAKMMTIVSSSRGVPGRHLKSCLPVMGMIARLQRRGTS